ncbi:MAG TPA: alpha/beta hydrolase [Cyclobacteriaceae bacterium]|nr:alpha/beta hydrolase [Cyclobacteriaceae bacterium]
MKKIQVSIFFLILFFQAYSQDSSFVVPLWQQGAPGFESRRGEAELAKDYWVKNIHNPSLTVFLPPASKANGAAVVICPGGGHRELVFNAEGVDAAKFFNSIGIAAFVLKYRLAREPGSPYTIEQHVKQDVSRAMRLVRSRAVEWKVDPTRLGIMGFSAGGEVVALIAYGNGTEGSDQNNAVDKMNARPDFQILIYPGPLGIPTVVAPTAPPAFLLAANDDMCCSGPIVDLLVNYRKAKLPIEVHLYNQGSHAFNMGKRSTLKSISSWPQRLGDWLSDNGYLNSKKK